MYEIHAGPVARLVEDDSRAFTLDLSDVPPEPKEDWMPPMNNLRWRVEFFFTGSGVGTGIVWWKNACKEWAEWVKDFTKPTGKIKDVTASIVAPDDSEEMKAQKIYAAVMKLENTAFTREKSKAERKKEKLKDINRAEDVWKQQAGSDDEIALLYVALARAAGLQVQPMKVVDRNRAMFDDSPQPMMIVDVVFDDNSKLVSSSFFWLSSAACFPSPCDAFGCVTLRPTEVGDCVELFCDDCVSLTVRTERSTRESGS